MRAAIVGAGHWGTRLIESVQGGSGKIRIVAAVTRDPAALAPLGKRFGLALTARYADVLADPAIDAVVLATPHSRHADEIAAAAQAGKHVFVEKPFTLTRESAERAIDKERAELEAFADAAAAGVEFVIAPQELVNVVAGTEAVAASARSGNKVAIPGRSPHAC
jgi:predicted dinucleotide-utilizing enzyme